MKTGFVKHIVLTLIISACFYSCPLAGDTESSLRAHLYFLASAELEGREAGYPGAEITARYIASQFQAYGLTSPPGAENYYQPVPLTMMKPDFANTVLGIMKNGGTTRLITDEDVFFFPKGGKDVDLTSELVLCGYGITAPEYDYDDYAGIDVSGKIVLVMNHEPQEDDSASVFNGVRLTKYSIPMIKARTAKEHGAFALLIMNPPNTDKPIVESLARYRKDLDKPIVQLAGEYESLPVFYLTEQTARRLLAGAVDLDEYHRGIDENLKGNPQIFNDIRISLSIRFKEKKEAVSPNVTGYLLGNDSELSNEVLIIGAHYDHLGVSGEGVFFGADDNASGTAVLIELAKVFANSSKKRPRSILFIAFTAEEKGALGSLYYCLNPLFPLEKTAAMINLDEVGRNGASSYKQMYNPRIETENTNYLMAMYSAQTSILSEFIEGANKKISLNIDFDPNDTFHGSSDHAVFHERKIPVIFFFTGFQPDYHQVSDTVDKINFAKMSRIYSLVFKTAGVIVNYPERLNFDESIKVTDKKKRMGF
ncbi:M20/M25/M40 family metallo-hydrolase [bacterium]|nr:M20/M25/M40 family metallo-hydrolase [bacterium]